MSSQPPDSRCCYTWPEDHAIDDQPYHQSSCWRKTVSEKNDRCIWHVDPEEVEKSVVGLSTVRAPPEMREQNSPYSELLDGANLSGVELETECSLSNVALRESNFSGANIKKVDLSGNDLRGANLSDAIFNKASLCDSNLSTADLTEATLLTVDLTEANLTFANLSNAVFHFSDLSQTKLIYVDFSESSLRDTVLSGADLRNAKNIESASVNGETICTRLFEGYGNNDFIDRFHLPTRFNRLLTNSDLNSRGWDDTARAYHDLKKVFSDHGLVGKARKKHVQERRARSLEAKAANGWYDPRYLGSLPSRIFTGYGVQIRNLVLWMVALFLFSTWVYVTRGVKDGPTANIAYSVLAFTVAPPPPMPSRVTTQFVMMIETFFGTLSIVLLGYLLGNRERF